MLSEAVEIIGDLFDAEEGATVNYRGEYFDVETARLWDRPPERVPIGIAVSSPDSCALAGRQAEFIAWAERELLPALREL